MMHELQPGDPQLMGPYRLLGQLGSGGMGQVSLGHVGGRAGPSRWSLGRAELPTMPEFRERLRRGIAAPGK